MKRLKIQHTTRYAFDAPVVLGQHQLMLRPREGPDLRLEHATLTIEPTAHIRWARDPLDNAVATLSFDSKPVQTLEIINSAVVTKFDDNPSDFIINEDAIDFPFAYYPEQADILTPFFSSASPSSSQSARTWASGVLGDTTRLQTYTALGLLCSAIKERFTYVIREEPGVQSVDETLQRGSGSCRDFANLLIEVARAYGLAARFISGYRYESGLPEALGATHAWTEVFIPGPGWKGFDPTVGALVDSNYVATAVARSPTDAPPVSGLIHGLIPGSQLDVKVSVVPA